MSLKTEKDFEGEHIHKEFFLKHILFSPSEFKYIQKVEHANGRLKP